MKNTLFALVLSLLVSARAVAALPVAQTEQLHYQQGNVHLVAMLAWDNCCFYEGSLRDAGWVSTTAQNKNAARFICYLTVGEVDMALACYRENEQGRIGTRVVETHPNECSTDTLRLLIGAGINNIIQDFRKNGYPAGCNAAGCFGESEGSPSD
ncbi:MAG: hypothetical protein QG664_561 [Patescibacteria group bacterium]|nr:hypothetical protein [Patescibacteria group bacterium]